MEKATKTLTTDTEKKKISKEQAQMMRAKMGRELLETYRVAVNDVSVASAIDILDEIPLSELREFIGFFRRYGAAETERMLPFMTRFESAKNTYLKNKKAKIETPLLEKGAAMARELRAKMDAVIAYAEQQHQNEVKAAIVVDASSTLSKMSIRKFKTADGDPLFSEDELSAAESIGLLWYYHNKNLFRSDRTLTDFLNKKCANVLRKAENLIGHSPEKEKQKDDISEKTLGAIKKLTNRQGGGTTDVYDAEIAD